MHPQHMQSSSMLHLPLVTAMTGQVKVAVFRSVLSHRFTEHVVVQKGERSSTFPTASNNKVAPHIQHIHLGDSTFRNESTETQAADSGNDTYQEVSTHRKGINQDTCQIVVAMSDNKGRSGTPSELQG